MTDRLTDLKPVTNILQVQHRCPSKNMRQHENAIDMRLRLLEAKASGNEQAQRQLLAELRRIELRELTPLQRDEQARHIAQQCGQSA